ncbi:MAG: A/G-specific adenine glycosylase [Gemmatimonadales bacterium]|nr:MAG: A/G-specific adenine glycosylase [Gemmatimonadales bacterium]
MAERDRRTQRTPGTAPWSREELQEIRDGLLAHFDAEARDLPWRGDPDPYRILVSEVMSQQTRLETVVPYYRRWMERFPELADLANAEEEEVLALWQGLGYYSRARNLRAAAREVARRYGGRLPDREDELRTLPGIGPYTAGAVASIAFGRPVPAVDGNVRRVLARLRNEPDPSPPTLRSWAGALVDPHRPGDFNQALMELGASICSPRSPDCHRCPLGRHCAGREAGRVEQLPARRPRGPVPHSHARVLVLRVSAGDGVDRYLLRRRPPRGLLARMWEFPEEGLLSCILRDAPTGLPDAPTGENTPTESGSSRGDAAFFGDDASGGNRGLPLEPVDHLFSHRRVTYHPRLVPLPPPPPAPPAGSGEGDVFKWVDETGLADLPIPVAQRLILAMARAIPDPRG